MPHRASAAGLVIAVAALVLLPSTGFAADRSAAGGEQAERGGSHTTALVSAGQLARGAGYWVSGGSKPVRVLQLRLRRTGFEPGPIDGIFGPRTQGAVLSFQAAHRLTVDGIVGPATKRTLLARPMDRPDQRKASGRSEPAGRERAAGERAAGERPVPDRPIGAVTPSPVPRQQRAQPPQAAGGAAPESQGTSGSRGWLAGALGAAVMGLLLGGAWLLTSRRRGGKAGSARKAGHPSRAPSVAAGRRVHPGLLCAALLAVFVAGAAAGALFASHAADGDRASDDTADAALVSPTGGPVRR
jgi:peptidoglycan hydrolase-like protein with peptidoglycan-binding domain